MPKCFMPKYFMPKFIKVFHAKVFHAKVFHAKVYQSVSCQSISCQSLSKCFMPKYFMPKFIMPKCFMPKCSWNKSKICYHRESGLDHGVHGKPAQYRSDIGRFSQAAWPHPRRMFKSWRVFATPLSETRRSVSSEDRIFKFLAKLS